MATTPSEIQDFLERLDAAFRGGLREPWEVVRRQRESAPLPGLTARGCDSSTCSEGGCRAVDERAPRDARQYLESLCQWVGGLGNYEGLGWYCCPGEGRADVHFENRLRAVLLNRILVDFLLAEGVAEDELRDSIVLEFPGGAKVAGISRPVPSCIARDDRTVWSKSVLEPDGVGHACADFILRRPFPVVGEIEIRQPGRRRPASLARAREWMSATEAPFPQYGIDRFAAAFVLVVDLGTRRTSLPPAPELRNGIYVSTVRVAQEARTPAHGG
jgi:hypothetical protein